jgi:high-affinity Fe2+/Pb2+ permease
VDGIKKSRGEAQTWSEGETGTLRRETELERLDRNLAELLNELRVALPGVQVLFAFLLGVPFTQRFTELAAYQEKIYYGTLLCAAAASAFLIAPSAHHRVEFRMRDKRHIVFLANRFAIIGLSFLALAMSGVVLLITDLLYGGAAAAVATGISACGFALLWYGMPLRRRLYRQGGRKLDG